MSVEKILIIGPSWVGDMVLAHSLFQSLKAQNPNVIIDVAAPAWTLPLLARMPEINEAIALPFKHGQLALLERIRFGRSLKNKGYQQAILLVNSLKSAILPLAAGIPLRTGFLGEFRHGLLNDIRPLDKTKLPRTVDRFVALGCDKNNLDKNNSLDVQKIANPRLIADTSNAMRVLDKNGRQRPAQKILGLCPGAEYGEAKRWPAEYYAEVANAALENGWQVWLFGSDKDTPVTAAINDLTQNRCLDWGGKTNLGEAIDLMSLCDTVISNDSGLMHVAAALEKKVIAIFGSSDPYHTPPMHPDAVIEYLALDCSPCFSRTCRFNDAEQHLACLRNITPQVISLHLMNL
ncbi:MAG: lipopolysaccharide heptosyltransferase II [Betaproteobacteria bacterium HGW-Betaproteobacteria-22]|nr:MAG: lipopolysaccharide heptosyltransferase II [Betaproteobacteria bacterium HGW-Betaproteobacteria-22]